MNRALRTRAPLAAGVVGVGHLGAQHARIYAGTAGVTLAGVQDSDAQRARRVAAELGCRAFERTEDLAAAVEALSIAVPAARHAEVAVPCLERGVAVLVEKPLAASVEAAEAIAAAAARSGAPLMVGHVERWNGAFRRARPHITRPRFIEGHRLSAFMGRGLDVDVIFDLMIHDLDLVLAVAGAPLRRVAAVGVPVLSASADIANARLEFEDGLVANLTASRVSRDRLRKLRIFQSNAYLSIDFVARRAELIRRRDPAASDPAAADPAALLAAEILDGAADLEPLAAELGAFIAAVRDGGAPEPGIEAGLAAVRLAALVVQEMEAVTIEAAGGRLEIAPQAP